jgi:hypothetical protein
VDELGFQNPPYMLAHFGKLTFPSYVAGWFFDQPVITHPPIHTYLIGTLCRMGFTIYYAEATPTVLLFLLAILCIVRSAFPDAVKLGLLFSVGYLMAAANSTPRTELFGTRPEGHEFVVGVTPGEGALRASIEWHRDMYAEWARFASHMALALKAMSCRLPLMLFSTAILLAVRWTRGLALAAWLGAGRVAWRWPLFRSKCSCIFSRGTS